MWVWQVADKRIAQLQVSLETTEREKEELQQSIQRMRQQVPPPPPPPPPPRSLSLGVSLVSPCRWRAERQR